MTADCFVSGGKNSTILPVHTLPRCFFSLHLRPEICLTISFWPSRARECVPPCAHVHSARSLFTAQLKSEHGTAGACFTSCPQPSTCATSKHALTHTIKRHNICKNGWKKRRSALQARDRSAVAAAAIMFYRPFISI